jgi:hypothetical protein
MKPASVASLAAAEAGERAAVARATPLINSQLHRKTFYCRHVARVLNRDLADTDVVEPLVYDRFSALALTDTVNTMLHRKLLAVSGTDNTLDYRLTLP